MSEIREVSEFTLNRVGHNMRLGNALNSIERALSANQGLREELLRDAQEIILFVTTQERDSE